MQINLPIHEPARHQEILDRIDSFRFHHQFIVHHIQHFHDACRTDAAFAHAGEKTVALQIIQPVHIQLTADQLIEETFVVSVGENLDGDIQCAVQLAIHPSCHQQRNLLVMDIADQAILQHMRKRRVTDIVKQNGCQGTSILIVGDFVSLDAKVFQCHIHQVHGADGVMEAGVLRTGIDVKCHSQLTDPIQSLDVRMLYQAVYEVIIDVYESENRVVDDFTLLVHFVSLYNKIDC